MVVYICSPYRHRDAARKALYREYSLEVMKRAIDLNVDKSTGVFTGWFLPIATHLMYPLVLDDDDAVERDQAMRLCKTWVSQAGIVYAGCRYGISEGMRMELDYAESLGISVVYLDSEVGGEVSD